MGSCKANLRGQTCTSTWAWVSCCWWGRLCHKIISFCVLNPTASSLILNNVINTMNVLVRFQRRSSVLMDCCLRRPTPILSFDEAQGTCVREEQASSFARKCEKEVTKANIEGFECPEGETIGPNGIPLAHPSFPHPTSCRKYIVCEFSTTPKELGCTDGLVFDHVNNKCVNPEDGPDDCQCWYSCPDNSQCPDSCNTDCSCP